MMVRMSMARMTAEEMQRYDDRLFEVLLETSQDRRDWAWIGLAVCGSVTGFAAFLATIDVGALLAISYLGPMMWGQRRRLKAVGKVRGSALAAALGRAGDPLVASARRLRGYDEKSILVRFSDNAGNGIDLVVPNDRIAELREAMGRRYPEAVVDLEQDLVLPARAVARLGSGSLANR
jgi:hypothetical protein